MSKDVYVPEKLEKMQAFSMAFVLLTAQSQVPMAYLDGLRNVVADGDRTKVEGFFQRAGDSSYLFEMARRRGGIKNLQVALVQTPPGWNKYGAYWAVFHTFQDIEQDHDAVYEILKTPSGWKLGREVPEWTPSAYQIRRLNVKAAITPENKLVTVDATVTLQHFGEKSALVMRLNDIYELKSAKVDNRSVSISTDSLKPKAGTIVRAGSLVIYWSTSPIKSIELVYSGSPQRRDHDKITENVAYITAWWTPSIGRLPFTTEVQIVSPPEWHARSEGELIEEPTLVNDAKRWKYRCTLPISYPKIIAGRYSLAAELKRNGRTYRSYQLDPVQKERAEKDVAKAADAMEFFVEKLGPAPWPGYDIYDADTYYGIESYSHTLLQREYTTTFVTHELGHTYFGGMAPCAYTKDSWNESLTQYLDSVLLHKNRDQSLEAGYRTANINVPLTNMPVPWAYGSATYYRGAYVMNMLAQEIGEDKVVAAMKDIVTLRRGKETTWADLRQYFEKHAKQPLGWFWSQWIESAQVPTVKVNSAECSRKGDKWDIRLELGQSGASSPYRLRYVLRFVSGDKSVEIPVQVRTKDDPFRTDLDFLPERVEVVTFPYTMARGSAPVTVIER